MKNKTSYDIFPVLLFSISIIFLTSLINKGAFSSDTLSLAQRSEEILSTHRLLYLQGTGLPFTALCGALFVFVTGLFQLNDPIFAVNLMSVVFSCGSIVLTYLIFQKMFGRSSALLIALLTLTHPLFLLNSVYGNSHTVHLFFVLLSYLLISRNNGRLSAALSGLCLGLAACSRLQDLIVLLPLITILLADLTYRKHLNITKLLLTLSIATLTVVLFYLPLYTSSDSINGFLGHFHGYEPQVNLQEFRFQTVDFFLGFLIKYAPPLTFLLFLTGIIQMFFFNKKYFWALLVWLIVPFLIFANWSSAVPRYFYVSVIPFCAFAVFSIHNLLQRRKLPVTAACLIAIGIIVLTHLGYSLPIQKIRHNYDLIGDYYRWIGNVTEENAIVIERDDCIFVQTYSRRPCVNPPVSLFSINDNELTKYFEMLHKYLEENRPVYITRTGLGGYTEELRFPERFQKDFNATFAGEHLSEDWHQDSVNQSLFYNYLLKVSSKK